MSNLTSLTAATPADAAHPTGQRASSDGMLRQAILTGATALLFAGAHAQTAAAATCTANTTIIAADASCTGPLSWTLASGELVNNGTISGATSGVSVTGAGRMLDTLTNTGTISASGSAIQIMTGGARVGTIINDGYVHSPSGVAIAAFSTGSFEKLINSGTIFGGIINRTTGMTIVGAQTGFGTLTSMGRTIESTIGGVVFDGGATVLDMNVNVGLAQTMTNNGATLKLVNNRTVFGNFVQNSGALVLVGTSPAAFSKLNVTGSAQLLGGDIILIPLSGTLTAGDYTVVTAVGGVTSQARAISSGFSASSAVVGNNLVVSLVGPPVVIPPVVIPPIITPPVVTPPVVTPPITPPAPGVVDTSKPSFSFADSAASGSVITFDGGTLNAGGQSTNQNITVLASGGTIRSTGEPITLDGALTNSGAFVIAGEGVNLGGSVTNTGTITFDGQGVIAGAVDNAGVVEVVGGKKVSVTGTVKGGVTSVVSGQLAVNGRVGGTVLQIQQAGALRGAGVIDAPTAVAGILAPGNSPGTLTFTQAVGFASTGVLSIDIDGLGTGAGAGNYSRVVVRGAPITVAGTLRPVLRGITGSATNSFTPKLGDRFNVIHADGGVTGAFSTLDQPASGLAAGTRFDVLYRPNDLDLVVTPRAYGDLAALGLRQTRNQRAAGLALDARRPAAGDAQTTAAFTALYGLLPEQIAPALDQVAGAVHGEAQLTNVAMQRQVSTLLDDRLSVLRSGRAGELQQASREGMGGVQYATSGQAAPTASQGGARQGSGVRAWGQVFGRIDTQDDRGAFKAQSGIGGAVAGADVILNDDVALGAALAFGQGQLKTKSSAKADLDLVNLSLYASARFGAAFVDGQVNGGWTKTESARRFEFGGLQAAASGEAEGWNTGASARVGYVLSAGGFGVEPSVGLRYDHIDRDTVTETGGELALKSEGMNIDALRSTVMVRLHQEVTLRNGALAPRLRLGWAHELGDRDAIATNSFAGGAAFLAQSNRLDRNRVLAGFDVAMAVSDNLRFYGDYGLEVGKNSSSNAISAGLRYTW